MDSQGDLFIADTSSFEIRRITPVASITNVTPASGTVQGGGTTTITWNSTAISGGVDILLSTDGGSTFSTTIATNVGNFGLYAWAVHADLSTTKAEIRVVDHNNASLTATSSATFAISQATAPIISTIAGSASAAAGSSGDSGPAINALLNNPFAVAVDSQGDLFIADGTSLVREINAATGVITTVAGNRTRGFAGDGGLAVSAEMNGPSGLALDGQGDLFIADEGNQRIREVNLSTGIITTVAGNGTEGFGGDGGPATNAKLGDSHWRGVGRQGQPLHRRHGQRPHP